MKTGEIVLIIGQAVDRCHAHVSHQSWQSLSRTAFVSTIEKTIPLIHQLVGHLESAQRHWIDQGLAETDELGAAVAEFQKLEALLQKNLELETAKRNVDSAANKFDSDGRPELYAAVEQKLLSALLKMRFLLERLTITAKKAGIGAVDSRPTAHNALTLLREKEGELQSLRFKYEHLRQNAYSGSGDPDATSDLVAETVVLERDLAQQAAELLHAQQALASQLAPVIEQANRLGALVDHHATSAQNLAASHRTLFTKLAKERDFARRILLDIEHESLKIRNQYSHELLHLHETRADHQKKVEEQFGRETAELRRSLQKQNEVIGHLKTMADANENRARAFENENKELKLALATHQKHAKIKNTLKAKLPKGPYP